MSDKRQRGRPRARFYVRQGGRNCSGTTADTSRSTSLAPSKETNEDSQPMPNASGSLPADDMTSLRVALLSMHHLRPLPSTKPQKPIPFFLDIPDRAAPWRLLHTTPAFEAYQWFDAQYNDYVIRAFKKTESVEIIWIGHPGDSPLDVRARAFVVRWKSGSGLSTPEKAAAIQSARPVLRWELCCAGVHDKVVGEGPVIARPSNGSDPKAGEQADESAAADGDPDGEPESEDDDDESLGDAGDGSEDDDEEVEGEYRGRWNRCGNKVKLRLEVTADDLTQ
ncbi:hypothetical protein L227DRAFT_568887, partial [Lentinus tigrinus ALCF2SS1-6]